MSEASEPVERLEADRSARASQGVGICLSGGGYRAMLFHLGSLLRLVEIGFLDSSRIPQEFGSLKRISSVSGGSITSAALGQSWQEVFVGQSDTRQRFIENVVAPIRALASRTIDIPAVLLGLLPFTSASRQIASRYRRYLFKARTLNEFPDEPRFVINATNLQSGALWRFMKPYTRDWRVGEIRKEKRLFQIAVAVGASSAFPPFLSPVKLQNMKSSDYTPDSGGKGQDNLQKEPFTTHPILSDGGVYDNLGLETVWKRYKTVLVSDGGGAMTFEGRVSSLWPLQAFRVLNVIDNQVRSLRKRQVIGSYGDDRTGAYWGIRTNIANYELDDALPCPHKKTLILAETPTRLKKLDDSLQERLINWGYAVCDAAIRKHVDTTIAAPGDFPYPGEGVG